MKVIEYKIKHHVRGRIKVHIPVLKKIPLSRLYSLKDMELPEGIKDVSPNPLTGNVVIHYDPSKVNIEEFLASLSSKEEIRRLLEVST